MIYVLIINESESLDGQSTLDSATEEGKQVYKSTWLSKSGPHLHLYPQDTHIITHLPTPSHQPTSSQKAPSTMSAVEFPPVTGSAPNFPVEAFGTRTFLPTVTFRTYSEPFTTKYGHPGIPYDQWAVTLNFAHTIPPAFQILPVCRFENFARVEFVEVCKRLDELCAKGSREDGWKGKRAFGRRDKEGYWVQEILRRFNEVERGRLIGRHVWPLKGKLLTVERVDMWIKLVLCKLVEQVCDEHQYA